MYIDTVERTGAPRASSVKLDLKGISSPLLPFLAFKEIWRNKGRLLLVSLVIALITTLVLFIAGLAEGQRTKFRRCGMARLRALSLIRNKFANLPITHMIN